MEPNSGADAADMGTGSDAAIADIRAGSDAADMSTGSHTTVADMRADSDTADIDADTDRVRISCARAQQG
jgi:hypothetical protein